MFYAIVNLSDHVKIFHCQLSVYLLQESENMQIIDALGIMAIPVMEFQVQGYKIRKMFA
jgi:hypothetical protein